MGRSCNEAPAAASNISTTRGTMCGALGETLWMCLDDSLQRHRVDHERRRLGGDGRRRQRRPQEVDLRQGVVEPADVAEVAEGGVTDLAGRVVRDQRALAVGAADERPVAAQQDVVRRIAPGQQHGAGRGLETVLDQRAGQPRDSAFAVHVRAAPLQHVESPRRGERDPDLFEHPERLLVDEVSLAAQSVDAAGRPMDHLSLRTERPASSAPSAAPVKGRRALRVNGARAGGGALSLLQAGRVTARIGR